MLLFEQLAQHPELPPPAQGFDTRQQRSAAVRITHIGTTDPRERAGGIPSFTWHLWRLLAEQFGDFEHEFSLSSDEPSNTVRDNVPVTVVAPITGSARLRVVRYFFWILRRSRHTELFWVHGPRLGIWALLLFPHKVVLHFHGPAAYEQFLENRSLVRFHLTHLFESLLYKRVRQIVCLSDAFKKKLTNLYGIDENKIKVIAPAWPLGERPKIPSGPFCAARPLRLITVRRLVKRTNVMALVQAVSRLLDEGHPVELKVIGAGPELEPIKRFVAEKRAGNAIQILGHVPDAELDAVWRGSDLFVLPTEDLEGFGMVILESYSKGVPVVGCNVDAIPSILARVNKNCIIYGTRAADIASHLGQVVQHRLDVWHCDNWQEFTSSFSTEDIRKKYAEILSS